MLSEDGEGEEALGTLDLAASFSAVRTLVLRCPPAAREGWPQRFAAFVTRNLGALQQLQRLDLESDWGEYDAPFNSTTLAAAAPACRACTPPWSRTWSRSAGPRCPASGS